MAEVHAVGRHVADAGVAVFVVVPGEEGLAVGLSVLYAAEARGEVGPVLQGLELPQISAHRVWVVVRDIGSAVALGDVEIDQQGCHRLGAHGRTTVGMQGEHAGLDVVAGPTLSAMSCWANSTLSWSAISQPTT